MEPEKGKYGLWYAGTVGFATKEEAQEYIDSGCKSRHEAAMEAIAEAQGEEGRLRIKESTSTIVWLSIAAVALVSLVGWLFLSMRDSGGSDRKIAVDALTRCQHVILSTAKYGDAESPPYRTPDIYADTASFVWEAGAFHFKNGFGAKVPQSAECVASRDEIKYLKMNGEVLIDR